MDEKEIIQKFEQKLVVSILLIGGLTAVAISIIFPVTIFPGTWRTGLIFGSIGVVMSIIGWRLKKKYQVSFS
jgi:hypothetical protein